MANLSSIFKSAKNLVAAHYGDNPGKLLIHTGVIGWAMSSLAQIFAIIINDKISKEQKMFLIPQEFADACVNIASFYLVTSTFKTVASKLVNQGKWVPKKVADFLNKNFASKIGKAGFDVARDAKLPSHLLDSFEGWRDGVDFTATTIGSVLSCNIITPLLRNAYASKRQQDGIAKMNNKQIYNNPNPYFRPSMADFQTNAGIYSSRSCLKV